MSDTLSDLLRAVRLRGALFFYVEGADPGSPRRRTRAKSFPRSCRASITDGVPWRRQRLVLGGDRRRAPDPARKGRHRSVSARRPSCDVERAGLRAKVVDPGIFFAPKPPQLPFSLSVSSQGETTALLDGGGPDKTTLVCGFLGCDAKPFNPLLASMPRMLRLSGLAADWQLLDRELPALGRRGVEPQTSRAARRCSNA
jgi:hypothetical protein